MNKKEYFTDIIANFNDPEWILRHITIALQRITENGTIKRPCDLEGLEQYLVLRGRKDGHGYAIQVLPFILADAGIDDKLAWEKAMENLCSSTRIESLDQILFEMNGIPSDKHCPLYVISNTDRYKGASAILNRKALSSFVRNRGTNMLYVLPSSVHEMIIVPYDGAFTLDELSAIVREINEKQVAPEERLADRAYIINV